ncbi:PREDICTED: pancreatic triacylglycerol lipase [Nicrophorus vespilloides]|uniref:Pancreatic triacylglycerol lipase n=1 Tax=Nicrophorus vespilloides TaxID=110193 RepID=A0ABM1MV62_NICVS|nr:PREDICTED: pancreatic triacylglycerol lipase [Nicrophorus vespilloides]
MVAMNTTSVILRSIFTILNITAEQEESSYNYYYINIGKTTNATRCYGIYGCFELSPPWTSEHRPVSLFPEHISKVEPKLMYYTRENPEVGVKFDLDSHDVIYASGINPKIFTYLVSHGYVEGGGASWIRKMTAELLKNRECNVITVDWQGGSSPPYSQAVANIRLVGAITAHFLYEFAQYTDDLQLDHVHCIGHSLGAHMSGYVGYTLQKVFNLTLGRITGMDPAEPHFAHAQRPVRLDRSAAKFVDIIHTDATQFIRGGLGMTEAIGHVDFYPNGGNDQPGCSKSVLQYAVEFGGLVNGIKKFVSCNHVRSHLLMAESINTKCSFVSISCKSYDDFKEGRCFECNRNGQQCLKMGFNSQKHYEAAVRAKRVDPNNGLILYSMTGSSSPFCKAHYKISVLVSDGTESRGHGGEIGQLWFVFHDTTDGRGEKTERAALNPGGYHEPGALYTAVVPADFIHSIRGVEVEWDYHSNVFNPLTWRILASPRVYISKIKIEALETANRISVCPRDGKPLISGAPQMMLPAYCAT